MGPPGGTHSFSLEWPTRLPPPGHRPQTQGSASSSSEHPRPRDVTAGHRCSAATAPRPAARPAPPLSSAGPCPGSGRGCGSAFCFLAECFGSQDWVWAAPRPQARRAVRVPWAGSASSPTPTRLQSQPQKGVGCLPTGRPLGPSVAFRPALGPQSPARCLHQRRPAPAPQGGDPPIKGPRKRWAPPGPKTCSLPCCGAL